jgi:hypothetical protein
VVITFVSEIGEQFCEFHFRVPGLKAAVLIVVDAAEDRYIDERRPDRLTMDLAVDDARDGRPRRFAPRASATRNDFLQLSCVRLLPDLWPGRYVGRPTHAGDG